MPFKSQAQRAWMHANHPKMAKQWEKHTPDKPLPKYTGKGTRARLNTAAEKKMFNSKYST